MPDTNPESIKALIQGITQTNDSVIEAKVLGTEPLQVQATNDEKLILSAASLVVPQHLTDYQITATFALESGNLDSQTEGDGRHNHGNSGEHIHTNGPYSGGHTHTNEGAHTHHLVTFSLSNGRITLFNALKVGDIVYMLPVNKGKKYFILDRRG